MVIFLLGSGFRVQASGFGFRVYSVGFVVEDIWSRFFSKTSYRLFRRRVFSKGPRMIVALSASSKEHPRGFRIVFSVFALRNGVFVATIKLKRCLPRRFPGQVSEPEADAQAEEEEAQSEDEAARFCCPCRREGAALGEKGSLVYKGMRGLGVSSLNSEPQAQDPETKPEPRRSRLSFLPRRMRRFRRSPKKRQPQRGRMRRCS